MKTTILLALCCLIVFTFTTKPLPAVSADDPESDLVIDLNRDPLRPVFPYYIKAPFTVLGGGVWLPRNGTSSSCPLHVLQDRIGGNKGMPVTFSLLESSKQVIAKSASLTIKFNVTTTDCDGSTVWKADEVDKETGNVIVTTGGIKGPRSSIFSIQSYAGIYSYKLVSDNRQSVALHIDSENQQPGLRLSDVPFPFAFQKADEDEDTYRLVKDN